MKFNNLIDVNDSGLDSDHKRAENLAKFYWQAGFTTPEKKLAMLR